MGMTDSDIPQVGLQNALKPDASPRVHFVTQRVESCLHIYMWTRIFLSYLYPYHLKIPDRICGQFDGKAARKFFPDIWLQDMTGPAALLG